MAGVRETYRCSRLRHTSGAVAWTHTSFTSPIGTRPSASITVGPDDLQVMVTKEQVESAPNIEQHGEELLQADESALYHYFELNYTPPNTESGRRLARR